MSLTEQLTQEEMTRNHDWRMKEFKEAIANLRVSGEWSDITIGCSGVTFKAHKAIICPRSKFFAKAFSIDMKEKRDGHIEITDKSIPLIKAMLEFFYTLDYNQRLRLEPSVPGASTSQKSITDVSGSRKSPEKGDSEILFHTKVYALAVQFDITGLRSLALSKLKAYGLSPLFNTQSLNEVVSAIACLIPDDDTGIRSLTEDIAVQRFDTLVNDPNHLTFVRKQPDFVWSMAKHMRTHSKGLDLTSARKTLESVSVFKCGRCSGNFYAASTTSEGDVHCNHCGRTGQQTKKVKPLTG